MKVITSSIVSFVLIGLLLWSMACTKGAKNESKVVEARHVIVIGVDAMSPNGIINATTPTLDDIMKRGAFTLNARGVLPTSSSTNWASMVSGAGPEQHGVTSNDWERDDFNIPAVLKGTEDIFPTIFGVSSEQRPELEMERSILGPALAGLLNELP